MFESVNTSNQFDISHPCEYNISSSLFSDVFQLDGNISVSENSANEMFTIPVQISQFRNEIPTRNQKQGLPTLTTLKRNSLILQSMVLPTVINLNPRSIYNKTDELYLLIEQYEADVICISESWERDDLPLVEQLDLENFEIFTNVKQREFKGGKPAILINKEKFHVKPLCPEPITVPIGVEAVWCMITPKQANSRSKIKHIAVASIYYRGPKSTKKDELFDHIAELELSLPLFKIWL